MFAGALALWVGVPLAWLYVGSQVQGETDSIGASLAVMFAGAGLSIAAIVSLLLRLNRRHAEMREARGLESYGQVPLEAAMGISAGVAVVGFAVWFFLFSGSSPLPTNLSF
jgi:ABC-type uncharacterized transport system permease subunit